MNERDRILQVMQSEGMNAKQFCQEVGISPGTLSNITGGRNKPSLEVMQAVLRRFRAVSCDWLIMGVGTMYINGAREEGVLSLFDNEVAVAEETNQKVAQTKDLRQCTTIELSQTVASSAPRVVSKIMIFYSDGTFEER